jgi:AraC-like DNA-binding protein
MLAWKCSTDSASGEDHVRVWGEAMQYISLPPAHLRDQSGFHGRVTSIISPLGIEFSRVEASAQTLSGPCFSEVPCVWLAFPVEGQFHLGTGGGRGHLRAGEIMYGPTGCDSTLDLSDRFVMLYIRVPQTMLHPRLLNLRVLPPGTLTANTGANRVFSGLLRSVAENLDSLTETDIRPVEIAVSEFVVASLAANAARGCFDLAEAGNFHRICQAVERQLGDGDLTLQKVADQQRLSPRYIQKLFQAAGLRFSPYLRRRRLEHCHADLANTALRKLSVSDISFRWGFNDAAHFSRSFRAEYGTTPREFRQIHLDRLSRAHREHH